MAAKTICGCKVTTNFAFMQIGGEEKVRFVVVFCNFVQKVVHNWNETGHFRIGVGMGPVSSVTYQRSLQGVCKPVSVLCKGFYQKSSKLCE